MSRLGPIFGALCAFYLGAQMLRASIGNHGNIQMAKAGDGGGAHVTGSGTAIGGDGGSVSSDAPPDARGGDGGDAIASVGRRLAIGGPGGRAVGSAPGLAGQPGGGTEGSIGEIVVGGGGGHAGGPGVWLPPARSGYEVHQRKLSLPVDPYLAQFGRGGAIPGYDEKLEVVDQIRSDYLRARALMTPQNMFNVNSVPLDHINGALAAMNQSWRARVVDDQFEFFAI
jgi:hypothetical protein